MLVSLKLRHKLIHPARTSIERSSRSAWRSSPVVLPSIKVGAATEVEQKEKQHRVEDALSATRAAAEEGILPGGGVAYIRAIDTVSQVKAENEDEQVGIDIVKAALVAPLSNIASNAGDTGEVVVEKVRNMKGHEGYNAQTGTYEDLVKAMVIDPKKVTRSALENAASVCLNVPHTRSCCF